MKLEARFDHQGAQTKRGFHWVVGQVQQLLNQRTAYDQALRSRVHGLEAMLQNKDDQIQKLTEERDYFGSAHQKALSELRGLEAQFATQYKSNAQSLANSSKVPDTDITGLWKQMHYNIRVLTSESTNEPPSGPLCPDAQKMMLFIHKKYRQILQDASLRDELLQAYIWALLDHDIWFGNKNIRKGNSDLISSLKEVKSLLPGTVLVTTME
jgi:hypothetical protein